MVNIFHSFGSSNFDYICLNIYFFHAESQSLFFFRELFNLSRQRAIDDFRLDADVVNGFFQLNDPGAKIFTNLFKNQRFRKLGENEQQDDGAESTANAIQKGKAEYLDISSGGFHIMANLWKDRKKIPGSWRPTSNKGWRPWDHPP